MKKIFLYLLFVLLIGKISVAQGKSETAPVLFEDQTRNIIYTNVEYYALGGSANISYERVLLPAKKFDLSVRGTYGRWALGLFGMDYGSLFKVTGNMLFFKGKNHLELDLGAMLLLNDNNGGIENIVPDLFLGYTYKKPDGHFVFKAGVGVLGFLSVGMGYAF